MAIADEAQALDAGTSDIGRPWERETAVRVMTGYVAHELNHPLGTIINLANILSRRLADPVVRSKDISEHVKNIKAEAVRATSIIKNMRMLTEHKPVAHESLSLVEVCHDTIARMKPLAKSKQVKIRFEIRTALVRVHGVKELLETALCNFIINSIAALDLANVTSRLVIIRILTPNPAETAIQVLDNGIGIPGFIRDKVFEPFVKTRPDGSGLGLAIASDIIRLHHGHVSCRRRKTGRAAFAPEEDVAVAAHAGVARPLVTRQAHETARRIERRGQSIELGPERVGDLKIVALVADHVDEGQIAGIAEIAFRRAHADGFAALPVQVAPVAPQRCGRNNAQRVGARELLAVRHEPQVEIAGRVGDEIVQHARAVAALDRDALRQSADRTRWDERERLLGLARRVAPRIL